MQGSDELTIELFLTNEEQSDYLKNHTPPRLRPASWDDISELSPADKSELLHIATLLISEIDSFFAESFLNIASGRGFDIQREIKLRRMWEEKVSEWAVEARQRVREGNLSFVPSPFEGSFISF